MKIPPYSESFSNHTQILVSLLQGVLCTKIQNGKPKLIAYASKRLPEAAKNYSLTELEMCRLAINIVIFAHLSKKVDFVAMVDHLALIHILKSKEEPATTKIIRLLEVLNAYSFNLYYMKGKNMILRDFCQEKEQMIVTHMKSYPYHLTCKQY